MFGPTSFARSTIAESVYKSSLILFLFSQTGKSRPRDRNIIDFKIFTGFKITGPPIKRGRIDTDFDHAACHILFIILRYVKKLPQLP